VDEELVRKLCQFYKIHNVDVLFRENATADQLIDVIQRCIVSRHISYRICSLFFVVFRLLFSTSTLTFFDVLRRRHGWPADRLHFDVYRIKTYIKRSLIWQSRYNLRRVYVNNERRSRVTFCSYFSSP
jgi:hypothetical protein